MLSRRGHRLSRFRKNKRHLRDRLRQRIFFRDRVVPELMEKPRVLVLTERESPLSQEFEPSARRMVSGKNIGLRTLRLRKDLVETRNWFSRFITPVAINCNSQKSSPTRRISHWQNSKPNWATVFYW